MGDLSSFSIQNPKQISSYLSLLLRNKCLFCARLGANGESYITALLYINEENNTVEPLAKLPARKRDKLQMPPK